MAKKIVLTEELINRLTAPYGLNKLDTTSKVVITRMLLCADNGPFRFKNFFIDPEPYIIRDAERVVLEAIHTQNYIIMRQLQDQKEELEKNNEFNHTLQEQNQQIINQNDTLVKQNEQIIALLTKISEK